VLRVSKNGDDAHDAACSSI